jgi:riboflavin kinase / FMN adenylyltransferase
VKIYTDLNQFRVQRPVVTIGTFDGIHRGHQKVIARLNDFARHHNGESVIFTFHTHPRLVTSPEETSLRLLTTLEEKTVLLERAGIDHLIIYPFNREFANLTYSEFVEKILVEKLRTHCLVVGYDHKFGKNREGGFDYLQKCAEKYNFHIEKLDALLVEDDSVSSTKIRNALECGDIEKANQFLGYPFTLHGTVVTGKQLGRKLGFPTANIESSNKYKIIPGYGVYAVKVKLKQGEYNGMLNIGTRPTFNNNADNRSIEVNIFDFDDDIYGQEITLEFVGKIRDEQKFSDMHQLAAQLATDRQTAHSIISKQKLFFD